MDIFLMIVYGAIVLSILVFIHEGGHYLAAKAFGVRVTEFMIGLPGPSIGFTWKGTRFGLTAVPLGGYAKICGMETDEQSPHLKKTLEFVYRHGTVNMEEVSSALGISDDDAHAALEQLTGWGSIEGPTKQDVYNTYRAPESKGSFKLGEARDVDDIEAFFESEYKLQYRSLPFWKRSVILLAGIIVNLLFAVLLFVIIYSVLGIDLVDQTTGEISHMRASPWAATVAGFKMISATFVAVIGLFNPATAAETVSNSTSIMGIAVMSKSYADMGFVYFLFFMALISISLGIMNLLPIPPLDGGRFVIEVFQKVTKRIVTPKAMAYMSAAGLLLFVGLFVIMLNQDIQRFIFGNW